LKLYLQPKPTLSCRGRGVRPRAQRREPWQRGRVPRPLR